MKIKVKVLFFLLAGCLVALAAWLVDVPKSAPADEVPEKYRGTVQKGLEYLVKSQFKDGHWEGDGGQHPVAMTGLAGLALLMEGGTDGRDGRRLKVVPERKYSPNIRKAVDWLMDKSRAERDGLIFSEHASETSRYMQGHGLATLFLAGAQEDERDGERQKKLNSILTRAVKYIVKAQSIRGGWYHTSRVEGHDFDVISATVIQIQALQAAENAGIPVPNEVISHAQESLKIAIKKYESAKPEKNRSRPGETAAALVCRFNSIPLSQINSDVSRAKDESCEKWFKYCRTEIPVGRAVQFGRDELTHYYYAQAVFLERGAWKDYRTAMFDHLLSSQDKDGSWPAGDGIGVGPVYSAAVWCTILQLDLGGHPSNQRPRAIIITRGPEPFPGLEVD
jgi:hypothetical protein